MKRQREEDITDYICYYIFMSETQNRQDQIRLPEHYSFVNREDISPDEIVTVRKSTGWEAGDSEEGWKQNLNTALAVVAVRDDTTSELVGMGFLVGNRRHAILCDFNVRPEHQGKGIGTAILKKRMQIADQELKIPFLYTSLAETNPLKETYKSLGFAATGDNYFRNGTV